MKTEAGPDEELLSSHPLSRKRNLDMAEITGGDGLWQRRIFIIIFFLHVPCASHVFSMAFLAPNLDHWCARPPEARNLSVEQWRNLAMPSYDQHCSRLVRFLSLFHFQLNKGYKNALKARFVFYCNIVLLEQRREFGARFLSLFLLSNLFMIVFCYLTSRTS